MLDEIEISTKQGRLRGLVKKSIGRSNKLYYSFQGIPYAKPPVGNLRFKEPEPYGHWEDTRDATKEGGDSLQEHIIFLNIHGGEDCLYLNVYTTKTGEQGDWKAVMVWIHGGGFFRGSGSTEIYGPDFLIEEDIVLVTINYRLGVLGFLSLENEKLPGNLGLKDQVLALKWVRDNIDSFGGNPNNVTIFGQSAGGASVHYHLLSPLSKELFHKAILQSGTPMCQWAFQDKPREKTFLLAKELGCNSQDPDTVLEFLMNVPCLDILKAQERQTIRTEKEKIQKSTLLFLPCVEVSGDAPFLPDYPRKMMEKGEFSKVPIIMGLTDQEGLSALAHGEVKCEKINENLSVLVPHDLAITPDSEEELRLGKEILQFYTNTDSLSWDVVPQYVDYMSDIAFANAEEFSRKCFLKHQTAPVYNYLFTYFSPRAFSVKMIQMAYPDHEADQFIGCGASHADELIHLFKTNIDKIPFTSPTDDDQALMNKLIKAWTAFAKTGNPNCVELNVIWKEDTIQNPCFMEIGKVWKSTDGILFPERIEFWNNIYEKYSYLY
ncbi:esterase FE4-like [Homalodisca vitripennis]|uniref:esterase FE4-like n=1 Tax=Homalodisca vitripennis TaxID=197043 RepID=UPI001EECD0AA|nr:esterase FE4-like [Homalodisca vitripennis]